MSILKLYNRFDIYIILLLASLVAGNLGGSLQIVRILTLFLSPAFIKKLPTIIGLVGGMWRWCLVFLVFSAISILWTPAGIADGIVGFVYNVVHLLLFFELIVFAKFARVPIKSILVGFLIAFVISAIIAFWEIFTDNHLSLSKFDEAKASKTSSGDVYVRYFAAVTFLNLNMYVTFLCFLLPFLFYGFLTDINNKKAKFAYLVATFIAIILVLFNGSRGGLLAVCAMMAIFVLWMIRSKGGIVYLFVILSGAVFLLVKYGELILSTLIVRMSSSSLVEDDSRFSIWSNVMNVVWDYCALGCGTGGLSKAMEQYALGGITAAHNIFLEILSQYGLIFCIVYISFLYKIIKRIKPIKESARKLCLYQSILSFPIIGIINSGYLTQASLFAVMASLYVLANYERIKLIH